MDLAVVGRKSRPDRRGKMNRRWPSRIQTTGDLLEWESYLHILPINPTGCDDLGLQ
jgi:hypothetical protein